MTDSHLTPSGSELSLHSTLAAGSIEVCPAPLLLQHLHCCPELTSRCPDAFGCRLASVWQPLLQRTMAWARLDTRHGFRGSSSGMFHALL